MYQKRKCYKVTVVLTYWEASGEVSELSYTSLLFISSKRSYCTRTGKKVEDQKEEETDLTLAALHCSSQTSTRSQALSFSTYFDHNKSLDP